MQPQLCERTSGPYPGGRGRVFDAPMRHRSLENRGIEDSAPATRRAADGPPAAQNGLPDGPRCRIIASLPTAADAPMNVTLTVTAGPHAGREFAFDRHDTFLVGRAKDAHLQLSYDDPYFSRRHFVVEVNPPRVRVMDLNSRNGIAVNGQKVRTADLNDGDELQAGHTVFRVGVPAARPRPPADPRPARRGARAAPGPGDDRPAHRRAGDPRLQVGAGDRPRGDGRGVPGGARRRRAPGRGEGHRTPRRGPRGRTWTGSCARPGSWPRSSTRTSSATSTAARATGGCSW